MGGPYGVRVKGKKQTKGRGLYGQKRNCLANIQQAIEKEVDGGEGCDSHLAVILDAVGGYYSERVKKIVTMNSAYVIIQKDTRSRYEEELNGMLEAAKGLIENIKEWREAILTNVDLRAAEFAAKEAKRTMGLS